MPWTVVLKRSVMGDLRWFGRATSRVLLRTALALLEAHPTAQTRNMRTLRANPAAQRELRLFGKYRVLFNVDTEAKTVTILLVGEKRGNALIVRGREYRAHHEGDPAE